MIRKCFLFVFLFSGFINLALAQKLFRPDEPDHYAKGILDKNSYDTLRTFLEKESQAKLKDTIIIKYNFNGDNCWQTLDEMGKKGVQDGIDSYNSYIKKVAQQRTGTSIFEYREKGNAQSGFKKLNNELKIDAGFLKKLLFKEKAQCGTAVIILPNRRCLFVKSDSHFTALELTTAQINLLINL